MAAKKTGLKKETHICFKGEENPKKPGTFKEKKTVIKCMTGATEDQQLALTNALKPLIKDFQGTKSSELYTIE